MGSQHVCKIYVYYASAGSRHTCSELLYCIISLNSSVVVDEIVLKKKVQSAHVKIVFEAEYVFILVLITMLSLRLLGLLVILPVTGPPPPPPSLLPPGK